MMTYALEYGRRRLDFYGSGNGYRSAVEKAIDTGIPIVVILPRCPRYYYPEGEQGIIPSLEDVTYVTKSGHMEVKFGKDTKKEIIDDLSIAGDLLSLGIPVRAIVPIIDTEVRRPARMDTDENRGFLRLYENEITRYVKEKNGSIPIEVCAMMDLVGNPSDAPEFAEVCEQMKSRDKGRFGVNNRMYEFHKDKVAEEIREDDERNSFYRSREFAAEIVQYEIADSVVISRRFGDMFSEYSGLFLKVPAGGGFYARMYQLCNGVDDKRMGIVTLSCKKMPLTYS